MEKRSAIRLHNSHVISLRASIHWKHGDIGKKDSNNKKPSYDDFHIRLLPSEGRWLSAEPLNLLEGEGISFERSAENPSSLSVLSKIVSSFRKLIFNSSHWLKLNLRLIYWFQATCIMIIHQLPYFGFPIAERTRGILPDRKRFEFRIQWLINQELADQWFSLF